MRQGVGVERWFYRDDADWKAFAERLKLTACPHCKAVGTLIRHGCLYGYDDCSPPRKKVRARRVFCSNRNRRRGCGRTVSVWDADKIRRLSLSTGTLWRFLLAAAASTIVAAMLTAIRPTDCRRSYRTWQRIWARFNQGQSKIRTALSGRCPPPECPPPERPPPECPPPECPPPERPPPECPPPTFPPPERSTPERPPAECPPPTFPPPERSTPERSTPECPPPELPVTVPAKPSLRPATQVLAHLRAAFSDADPIASFQHTLHTFFV